jgi:trk system potassium uptake protein TrkA
MNIIIIGCGKVGAKFARALSDEGHDVVIVDSDKKAFASLNHDFNGLTVTGVPIDQDVLKQAGIETADAFAAVTPDDNVNIMSCQVAKEVFNVPRVIARIYNPEREHVFHQFGLDTICPTNLTVDVLRSKITGEAESNVSHHIISGEAFTFRKEPVNRGELGKKLGTVKISNNSSVFGILHEGIFSYPDPNYRLSEGDILIISSQTH